MPNAQTTVSRQHGLLLSALVVILLLGLPIAVWLDLRNLAEAALRRQATDLNSVITSVRGYLRQQRRRPRSGSRRDRPRSSHNYETDPGRDPDPGDAVARARPRDQRAAAEHQLPLRLGLSVQEPHAACARRIRERRARRRCAPIRTSRSPSHRGSMFSDRVRLIAPVMHGGGLRQLPQHAIRESPKTDWKVGDVRGIQEVTITQPIAANLFSFKYLLDLFRAARRSAGVIVHRACSGARRLRSSGMNRELETANDFLASLSMKISRYLSPQIYKSIFSGQKDVAIHTERKKLTIFFSDIKDFTATTERLQPEQLTQLLNEYFTEMSAIALAHGGTIDKFVGDAMLIFFGDPETKGEAEDAQRLPAHGGRDAAPHRRAQRQVAQRRHRAAVPRAHGHQHRLLQCRQFRQRRPHGLHDHRRGGQPRRAAAVDRRAGRHRHQLRDLRAGPRHAGRAHPLPPITMKGISREVVPYAVEGHARRVGREVEIFSEHMTGLDLYLDPAMIDAQDVGARRGAAEAGARRA